jgi:hypothetical protein
MSNDILVELISGITATVIAIGSALYAYFVTDRQKKKQELEMEKLRSELQDNNSERNARRDYEYEARKKLYEEYEPVFFRFSETAEWAYYRIKGLANRAAEGRFDEKSWLKYDSYYLQSTIYYLMAPLSYYILLRRRLTFVDLRVDKNIYSSYILGKILFASFSDAFVIAQKMGVPYTPFEGANHTRQDIPIGITENIADLIIEVDTEAVDSWKVLSLAKFQNIFKTGNNSDLQFFEEMLMAFHPQRLPVLWGTLIVQVIIYKVIINLRKGSGASSKQVLLKEISKAIDDIDISDFDWHQKSQQGDRQYEPELLHLFSCAHKYIEDTIEEYY